MKKLYIIAITILLTAAASAQTVDDACLFSQTYYQGTAKALGMGNAMGAVGGDMTAVCINPASMGIGTQNSGNKVRFSLPNVGYVHAKEKSNFRALRFAQFGVGFTRTNDFNLHTNAMGINPNSSKIDDYLAQIDGYAVSDLQESFPYTIYPAWSTYLIDTIRHSYVSPVPPGNIWQGQECDYTGRSEAWTFAGSFNFYDRFFIGISADLAHVKRVGNKTLKESSIESTSTGFNQWSFDEDLRSTGWGGNLKIGFIFHATPWLRIGGAFHSPTIFNFSETWQTTTESEIDLVMHKYISPESHYEYNFFTPLKCVGSLAFVIGQQGMVSIDAEYTNYGAARFKAVPSDDFDYGPTNENIKNLLLALKSGDLDTFINITESEALQLHALMMCSNPSFILMKPNTLNLINEIREFREETKIPLCFTLDAGPNVHLLYPEQEADKVEYYIKNVLADYCDRERWIADHVGDGPKKLL